MHHHADVFIHFKVAKVEFHVHLLSNFKPEKSRNTAFEPLKDFNYNC